MVSNLEYYRAFLYVAQTKSFTKAAELLHLTQSAVSQSVKKLETELDCTLFTRMPRKLVLTKEGESLYRHVQNAIAELQHGELIVRQFQKKEAELKIGATETSIRYFLQPLIRQLKKSTEKLHITMHGTTTGDLCRQLTDGELEMAILISPLPEEYHFHLVELGKIQDIFVASPEFEMDFDRVYTPSELIEYPTIFVSSENAVRTLIDEWFLEDNVVFRPSYTVRSMTLVQSLVKNTLGIGVIPFELAREDISAGKLVKIKTVTLPPARTIYLATNYSTTISPSGQEFIRLLLDKTDSDIN